MRGYSDEDRKAMEEWLSEQRAKDARTFTISVEAAAYLEVVHVRSGHIERLATIEWLIRAMADKYARFDREKAREIAPAKRASRPKRRAAEEKT